MHRGLLPMVDGHGSQVRLLKETQVVDHAGDGHPGLISIFSVRYTTARHSAETAVDMVMGRLGRAVSGTTATSRVASARFDSVAHLLDEARAHRRARHDASAAGAPGRQLRHRLAPGGGPGVRTARAGPPAGRGLRRHRGRDPPRRPHEAAITLADAVLRRTEAGTAGHPGRGALEAAAAIMAAALGWDTARVAAEVADVEAVYPAGAGSVS